MKLSREPKVEVFPICKKPGARAMNRNLMIGVGVIVLIILVVLFAMPSTNEPEGDVNPPAATNNTPAAPAPSN